MKKLIGTISLILSIGLIPITTHAQIDFGIRGGLNFATIRNLDVLEDLDIEQERRIGFLAGVYVNFSIPKSPISIQPEVLYTQKGIKRSVTSQGQELTQTIKLDYIAIPVLVKLDLATGGNLTPHIYLGPYLAINVTAESEFEGGGESQTSDFSDNIKNTDFGAVFGAGVSIGQFNVGARYSLGLTKLPEEEDADAKNGVISIVAGFSF